MRGRRLNFPAIGRAAGFALIATAIVAVAVHFAHDTPGTRPHPAQASAPADPLTSEMSRCEALATAAKDDAACEAAWAENRRRFFTYRPASSEASATAPAANTPKQ